MIPQNICNKLCDMNIYMISVSAKVTSTSNTAVAYFSHS